MRIGLFGSTPLPAAGAGRSSTMARWLGVVVVEAVLASRFWGALAGVAAAEIGIVAQIAKQAAVQSWDVMKLIFTRGSPVGGWALVAPPSVRMRFRYAGLPFNPLPF